MNSYFSKFIVYAVALTVVLISAAHLVISSIANLEVPIGIYWTIPLIGALNMFSFKMLVNAKAKNPYQFVNAFTLSMGIKFVAAAIILLVCGLLDRENFKPVALSFGCAYMAFLILEVIFVKKELRS